MKSILKIDIERAVEKWKPIIDKLNNDIPFPEYEGNMENIQLPVARRVSAIWTKLEQENNKKDENNNDK